MADNTARRGIYLPKELDDWFVKQSEETGIKTNQLMLDALNQYKDENSKSRRKKNNEFVAKIEAVIEQYNRDHRIFGDI